MIHARPARDHKCPHCHGGYYKTISVQPTYYVVECLNVACGKTFVVLRPAA